jgi:hypothetical protein
VDRRQGTTAVGRRQPSNAPTTLGSSRPERRRKTPTVGDLDPKRRDMWKPPSGRGGGSRARIWCGQLGHPLATRTHQLSRALFHSRSHSADHFPSRRTPPAPQLTPACSQPFPRRAEGERTPGPPAHNRLRISFLATKMAHRSFSANHLFLWGKSGPHLAIRGTDRHYRAGTRSSRGICR